MENKTRNNIIIFCAVALTVTICFKIISDEIDKRRAINELNNLLGLTSESLKKNEKGLIKQTLENRDKKTKQLIKANKTLSKRLVKAERELKKLKAKFAVQINSEKTKENIKWSDGTKKPKYNQTQEGINWSNK